MPETKQCPFCGETILAVAKKCKYCGSWIEPKHEFRCPVCCEVIPEDSIICPVCHERLKPDPEPVEAEPHNSKPSGTDEKMESAVEGNPHNSNQEKPTNAENNNQGDNPIWARKWLLSAVLGIIIVLGLVAFFVFKPSTGGKHCYQDATAIHEWLFENLGTHVNSFSDCPELQARLKKHLGNALYSKVEEMMKDSYMSEFPNLAITHLESEADMYQFNALKYMGTSVESFVMEYTDYGDCGFLHMIAFFDGKRTEKTEKHKAPEQAQAIVRQYEYSGKIGSGRSAYNTKMTLWIDNSHPGESLVRGYYLEEDDSQKVYLSGGIYGSDPISISLSFSDDTLGEIDLEGTDSQLTGLKGDLLFNQGHSYDVDGPQGMVCIPIRLSLDNSNPKIIVKKTKTYNYDGKIYDSNNSYDIEMELEVEGEGGWEDTVKGSYRYKSQPANNRINLSGEIFSEKGVVMFLNLYPQSRSECFSFTYTGDFVEQDTFEGEWMKTTSPQKEMKFTLKKR